MTPYEQGFEARINNLGRRTNPYASKTNNHVFWNAGYEAAKQKQYAALHKH